jgi:enoyl-CoA hydratase/carnithine racemase
MAGIRCEFRGSIAILTLDDPERLNALDWEMLRAIDTTLDRVLATPEVRCIVLTGAGKGFCAGARLDPEVFSSGAGTGDAMRETVSPLIEKMRTASIPIVVAVNGPAAGAGCGIALAGDIVVAARSAKFVLSFVKLGAVLDGGTSMFFQRAIGTTRARALALTGDALPAAIAAEWGLIWKCVDDDRLLDEALAIAEGLAAGPPLALAMIKRQSEDAWAAPLAATLEVEATLQTRAFVSEDLREGATAFVERRKPVFRGR